MSKLDLNNIQGDILLDGLPKRVESFFFFQIVDGRANDFCRSLKQVAKEIAHVGNTAQMRQGISDGKTARKEGDLVEMAGANIAFSWKGLQKVSKISLTWVHLADNQVRWPPSSPKTSAILQTTISQTA
jgi:hypothetical protein